MSARARGNGQSPKRLDPLPPEHSPELKTEFDSFLKSLGFVPNSVLTMQRKPKLVKAFVAMQGAIWDPDSKVDRGFKRLVAHVASRTAHDEYSMAHTASGALHFGVAKTSCVLSGIFATAQLFSDAEKAALDLAVAAGSVPNAVTRRSVREAAHALDRRADRRTSRCHRDGRISGALEHDDGDAA